MKKGLLLVNLGSPDSATPRAVRRYLDEFLMDRYVIDYPYLLRALLVKGIILNTRPKKSARAYQKIWWTQGSPLIVLSKCLTEKVRHKLGFPVALGMRYGAPSLATGLGELADQGVTHTQVIPLYPHYAMSTTKTVTEKALSLRERHFKNMQLDFLPPFYKKPTYIQTLAESIRPHLKAPFDQLLFSYHGIPERHIRKTDPTASHCQMNQTCCQRPSQAHAYCYRHQCLETTRLVQAHLGLPDEKVRSSFQSRLGRDPWLRPYTDETLRKFPAQGVKKLLVVTPAFVADCLETLEEIGMEGQETFLSQGGARYEAIPCLNDDENWAALLARWAQSWARETSTMRR